MARFIQPVPSRNSEAPPSAPPRAPPSHPPLTHSWCTHNQLACVTLCRREEGRVWLLRRIAPVWSLPLPEPLRRGEL